MKDVTVISRTTPAKPRSKNYSVSPTIISNGSGNSSNNEDKLDTVVWDRNWVEKKDPNGLDYLFTTKPIVTAAGVTMYSGDTPYLPSMFEGIPLDGETLAWVDGKITVIGGTGQGGITGINVTGAGNAVTGASLSADGLTITLTKGSEFALKSDIPSLSGYATENWVSTQLGNYATSSSLKTVSEKLNNFLEGTDTDGIINKWKELEAFLSGFTETDTLASALSVKADKSVSISAGAGLTGGGTLAANRTLSLSASGVTAGTYTKTTVDVYGRVTAGSNLSDADIPSLDWSKIATGKPTTIAGYGITDAYTKNEVNTTLGDYVTLVGAQNITGVKSFINGLKIGDITVKKHATGVIEIDGDLIVTGGVTMYAQGNHSASTILDALPIDADTLSKEGGVLSVIGGVGGGSVDGIILNGTTYSPNSETKLITLPNYPSIPSSLKNPYSITFTGYQSKTYDGSSAVSVAIPTTLPASDVYAWAKAANKPSYSWTEITSKPSWIGSSKPSYAFSEITGKPTTLAGYGITDAVTLNTTQTITNTKTFTAEQRFNMRSIYFQNAAIGGSANGLFWQKNGWGGVKAGIGVFTSADGDPSMYMGWGENPWNAANNFHVSSSDIQYKGNNILHSANYTNYLDSRYVNATGDTMSGPLTIATSGDTKLILQSTDTDNYNLISARNSSGVQLSYLGYAGEAWRIDGGNILTSKNYAPWLDNRYYTETEADSRFVNVSGDTVTGIIDFRNKVIVNSSVYGGTPIISLAIGDSDSGFNSTKDGALQMVANSITVAHWDSGSFNFAFTPTAYGNTMWHSGNDGSGSGLDADLLDGRHRSNLYNGISHFLSTVGTDIAITVAGDANTYYPVYIEAGGQTDKNIVGYLSVYKNLGSATASYPGNHSNGTSSLWVSYEFRSNIWDGNGGYVRTMYKYEGYATLISQVATYSPKYGIVVWLRGGGTEYRISYSNGKPAASIYYSETNLNNSQYPAVVAPRTDIGNGGIIVGPTIFTNVESATKLRTARTLWGQSFNGTANVGGDMSNVGTILSSDNNTKRIGSASNQWEGIYAGWISGGTNQSLRLAANNADKVWILTNGNVGIGTSSPSYKLHVNGGIYATGTSDINGIFRCGTSLLHKFVDQDYLIRDKRALVGASDALYISYAADWGTVNIRNNMVIVNGDGLHCANWLRVAGANGIYFSDKGGGLHMEDSAWVKVYNGKAFRVNNLISCGDSASYNDNTYGIMNVTRPNNKNYCCYAFVRSGTQAFGMGFTTNAEIWLGTPNSSKEASNIFAYISSAGIYAKGGVQANNGKLKSVYNGQTFDVGSENSSYCHYNTTAGSHWFNKQVSINGTLYPYGAAQNIGSKDTPWGNIYSSGWFRSTGDSGWYSEKYGGGLHMTDTTYVRVYNGRSFYVPGNILATGGVTMYGSDVTKKDVISRVLLPLDYIARAPLWRYRWNDRRNDRVNVGGSAQYTRMMLGELVGESDKGLVMDYATTAYAFSVCTARHFRDFLDNEFRTHETEIDKLKKENEKMKRRIVELERRVA